MRGLCATLALAMFGAAAVVAAVPASAQEDGSFEDEVALPQHFVEAYGWWTKAQQSPAGGQAAPSQPCQPTPASACPAGPPADGLYVVHDYEAVVPGAVTGPVNNAPAAPGVPQAPSAVPAPNASAPQVLGPTAYGAVRYVVPEGAATELTLQILSRQNSTPGGEDPGIGTVFGCLVTTAGWPSAQNGRYDQGPKYDCSSADQADLNGDAFVFSFPPGMVQNGNLDVAIVGAGTKPFQVAFAAPKDANLVVTNADELLEELASQEELSEDLVLEDPIAEFEEATATLDSFGELPTIGDEFAAAPGDDAIAAPAGRPQSAVPTRRVVNPFSPDASRAERIMAVAVLLIMGTGLWWLGGMPMRPPRLLGSLGNGRATDVGGPTSPGGIGRFVRERTGRPPRLF